MRFRFIAAIALLAWAVAAEAGEARLSLEECLAIARQRNLDIQSQRLTFLGSELSVATARAAFLPTFGASASRSIHGDTESAGVSLSQALPTGTTLSLGGTHSRDPAGDSEYSSQVTASVSQQLGAGIGTVSGLASLRTAAIGRIIAEHRFERRCQDIVQDVTRQYYDMARLMATIQVRRLAVERARSLLDEAEFKRERGLITVLDHANAAIQLADRETALVSSVRQLEDSRDALRSLLDMSMDDPLEIVPVSMDVEEVSEPDLRKEIAIDTDAGTIVQVVRRRTEQGWRTEELLVFAPDKRDRDSLLEQALSARPDLAVARLELEQQDVELRRRRNQLLGDVRLSASYSASGEGDAPSGTTEFERDGASVSLTANWPLGRVAKRADYERALIELQQREISARKLEVSIEREIRRLARSLRETEANILTYSRKISAAGQALESSRIRKERGQASYWEVTARESDLLDAQTSFINTYLAYMRQLSELDRAVGARTGWECLPK